MTVEDLTYDIVPVTRIRRATAKRMRASVQEKPPVTLHRPLDAAPLFAHLEGLREGDDGGGGRPTLTSVLAVALGRVLERDPMMNSCVVDGELRHYHEVHLAVAIATDDGLVPPVLRPRDLTDDRAAATALTSLGQRARAGGLKPDDFVPSTFTLTNLGVLGIEYFTPILNPPHVGILGVGRSPDPEHGLLPLSLTFDHAALDGIDGARFLQSLADEITTLDAS